MAPDLGRTKGAGRCDKSANFSAQEEEYAKQSAKLEGAKKQLSDGEQKLQDTKAALDGSEQQA
ncbi:MAG: hypothetical protein ACLR71_09395 [[Clostridium] scindens]